MLEDKIYKRTLLQLKSCTVNTIFSCAAVLKLVNQFFSSFLQASQYIPQSPGARFTCNSDVVLYSTSEQCLPAFFYTMGLNTLLNYDSIFVQSCNKACMEVHGAFLYVSIPLRHGAYGVFSVEFHIKII